MYMHKSMVCKVSTFSYNSGSTGVPIYHGSIDSIKDRCVNRTCPKKYRPIRFYLRTAISHVYSFQEPLQR